MSSVPGICVKKICDKSTLTVIEHVFYDGAVDVILRRESVMIETERGLPEVDVESVIERDLLPEYYQYRDEGCELAGSCLECPFPYCICEEKGGRQGWLKRERNREITRLFYEEKVGIVEIARRFEVSTRTVQRAIGESVQEKMKKNCLKP